MKESKQPASKYRPVLTAAMIDKILALAKSEVPITDISISIISTLVPFKAKIDNAAITAAYTPKPAKVREDLLSSLGGLAPSLDKLDDLGVMSPIASTTSCASKEEYWAACYAKYTLTPTDCSLEEIEGSNEHKYLNGLMSIEEIEVFESRLLGNIGETS
jgi:hypothetical protein